MTSGFVLPVRVIGGGAYTFGGNTPDPTRFSILGEPLSDSHVNGLGPALGLSVASVIAMATLRSGGGDGTVTNTANAVPFQLPIRRVNDFAVKPDLSARWESL